MLKETAFNQIICGDCIQELDKLPAEIARIVVADPPYFNVLLGESWDTLWKSEADYLAWTKHWLASAMRVLVPGGLLFCFGQVGKRESVFLHLMSQAAIEYSFHDLVIWDRVVGYNNRADSFNPCYEMILVLRKNGGEVFFDKDAIREPYDAQTQARYARDKRYKNAEARREHLSRGKYATNVWRIPSLKGSSKEKVGHPSQKPEALIERIIQSSTRTGDLVIDPFSGSGTTAVIAQKLGRNWIGIEKDEEFVQMASTRLNS